MAVVAGNQDPSPPVNSGAPASSTPNLVVRSLGLASTFWLDMLTAAGRGWSAGLDTFFKQAIEVSDGTSKRVARLTGVGRNP